MRFFWNTTNKRAVPPGIRVYAIGDIHGRSDLLARLLERIGKDTSRWSGEVLFVFLGDYVDRGPDSRGVVDMLLALAQDAKAEFLRGNHDQAVLDFIASPSTYPTWQEFGAAATLTSYDVQPPPTDHPSALYEAQQRFLAAFPAAHRSFLQKTKLSFTLGDYFFCHAGARPGVALGEQSARDLMWMRDTFLQSTEDFGKTIVHGHSPSRRPVRMANRIGIDTDAYASGVLTAAVLEDTRCRFIHT